jgi:hypothetical protein
MASEACKVCKAVEADIINRLLEVGYGPGFVSARWGLKRHHVKKHRDECLVGERRKKVEADRTNIEGGSRPGSDGHRWSRWGTREAS